MSSQGAIKMGRAFVELFVEDNKLYRGLDLAGAKFKGWGTQLKGMGAALGSAGGGILAPLITGLAEVTERANGLQVLSDRLGESVTVVSTLAGGFERAGVGADQFGGIMEGLRTKVAEAADANGYLLDNLRSLGPAARLAGLPTRELLNQIADSVHRIPNAVNQLRAARSLGLEGILPQLRKGKAGIDELFASGGPGALTEEEGRQSVEVTRAATAAWKDFKDTGRQVFLSLLPNAAALAETSAQFKGGLASVREWIKENRAAVVTVAAVGAGLLTAGAVAVGLGLTVAVVGKGIMLTVAGVKIALAGLFSPLGLVAAGVLAVGAGAAYLAAQTEAGQQAVSGLTDDLAAFAGRVRETFAGVSDALGAGDWSLAWKIGLAGLKAEWENFAFYFQLGWNLVKETFVDGWKDAVAGLKVIFLDLSAFVARNTAGMVRALVEKLAGVAGTVNKKLGDSLRASAAGIASDDQINAERDAQQGAIIRERQREQAEADAARRQAATDAYRAREAARAELAELTELARWRAEFARMPWLGEDEEEGAGGPASRFHGPTRLADVVKGGFGNAVLGQQLGIGDSIPQQQLDATRGVMANTSQLPQMAKDVNTLARGEARAVSPSLSDRLRVLGATGTPVVCGRARPIASKKDGDGNARRAEGVGDDVRNLPPLSE